MSLIILSDLPFDIQLEIISFLPIIYLPKLNCLSKSFTLSLLRVEFHKQLFHNYCKDVHHHNHKLLLSNDDDDIQQIKIKLQQIIKERKNKRRILTIEINKICKEITRVKEYQDTMEGKCTNIYIENALQDNFLMMCELEETKREKQKQLESLNQPKYE